MPDLSPSTSNAKAAVAFSLPVPAPLPLRALPFRRVAREPVPNRTLKDQYWAEMTRQNNSNSESISVTKLVDPRQAYWQAVAPETPVPIKNIELMESGKEVHERFSRTVTVEAFREQWVTKEGITGIIDIFEDHPVEVKSTSSPVEGGVAESRPGYLMQLMFYCAMVGKNDGHIVVVSRSSREVRGFDTLQAYRVRVDDLGAVWEEAKRRRDLLKDAIKRRDPSSLPGCEWFGRCRFTGTCDCTGGARPEDHAWLRLATVSPDEAEADRLRKVLIEEQEPPPARPEAPADGSPPPVKIRTLGWLRRHLVDALSPPREEEATPTGEEDEATKPGAPATQKSEELRTLSESVSYTGMWRKVRYAAHVNYVPVRRGALDDPWVAVSEGMPLLFKMPGLWTPADRDDIFRKFPDDVAALAVQCALLGKPRGRLVFYYPRVQDERQKFLVYDVAFREPETVLAALDTVLDSYEKAWRARDPRLAPACPEWAVKSCPLGERCACRGNDAPGRADPGVS